jgi:hypothetical protein
MARPPPRTRTTAALVPPALALALATLAPALPALAQDASATDAASVSDTSATDASAGDADGGAPFDLGPCPEGAVGCARAPIAYRRRVGLPIEFSYDTGWVPAGSPVQVRFVAALQAHTEIALAGTLEGAWPQPMTVRAVGTPGAGSIASDYGVVLSARVRLHLETSAGTFDWEGDVPYVPHIDFRATAQTTFDPWAWNGVMVSGSTARQHLADVSLTDSFIPIPGVSLGLSFDAQAQLVTGYRSLRFTFGGAADPFTQYTTSVLAAFTSGPSVVYWPRLEGQVSFEGTLSIFPALYVSVPGGRWMVDLFEIPVPIGPIPADWNFDPARAELLLPDVVRRDDVVVDFGDVLVGTRADDAVPFQSVGPVDLWVASPPADGPFSFPHRDVTIAPSTIAALPVEFAPTTPGRAERRAAFQTNDPDTPTVWVTLRGNGVMADAGVVARDASPADVALHGDDAGTGAHTGGCGCRAAGDGRADARAAGALCVGLAVLGARSARRRRRRKHG